MSATTPASVRATPEETVERVFDSLVRTVELFCIYVGDQLGFYRALHEGGPATSTELSARAGTNERYTREWLEQQATAGFLSCANPEAGALERSYALPEGYAAVFVDRDSPSFVPPMAQGAVGAVVTIPQFLEAFSTGAGVP